MSNLTKKLIDELKFAMAGTFDGNPTLFVGSHQEMKMIHSANEFARSPILHLADGDIVATNTRTGNKVIEEKTAIKNKAFGKYSRIFSMFPSHFDT
jgi:hypothetical protein